MRHRISIRSIAGAFAFLTTLALLLGACGTKVSVPRKVILKGEDRGKSERPGKPEPFTELDRIFVDGYSLKYNLPNYGVQDVTISLQQAGDLVLTSGELLPWDLLIVPDARYSLKRTVTPGRYPVVLAVANFRPSGDTRIACAKLQFGAKPPVRWEAALVKQSNPDASDRFSYGVDSGTGSFMDTDVARQVAKLGPGGSGGQNTFEQFCNRVLAAMDEHRLGGSTSGDWANVEVNHQTGANVIIFSSGWGDGDYASFWGYDESGNVVCLVTDFALFEMAAEH